MLLYDIAAACVAGVNDVVSLLGSLSFYFVFLHVLKPPVLDQNIFFKAQGWFLQAEQALFWVSVVGTVITKIRLFC